MRESTHGELQLSLWLNCSFCAYLKIIWYAPLLKSGNFKDEPSVLFYFICSHGPGVISSAGNLQKHLAGMQNASLSCLKASHSLRCVCLEAPSKECHPVGAVAFRAEMRLLQTWGLNRMETVGPWISLFSKTLVFWSYLILVQLSQNPYLTHYQENPVILTLSHSAWWENRLDSGRGGANRDYPVQDLFF